MTNPPRLGFPVPDRRLSWEAVIASSTEEEPLSGWGLLSLILLGSLALVQAALVLAFSRACWRARSRAARPLPSAQGREAVVVVLCVRGADPSLVACLHQLARQTYADFSLLVVADEPGDPGLELVRRTCQDLECLSVRERVLRPDERLETCSLKCSALLAAATTLPETCQFLALIDADTLPPPDWLERLLAPFAADDRCGATTALRWYDPPARAWGAQVRAVWNAAAIVQMWWYGIAWGGSLAIRRSCLEQARLAEYWRRAFCEDTSLSTPLRRAGFRVDYVLDLVVRNDEPATLPQVVVWMARQLLTARLHHPLWLGVLAHAVLTSTVVPLAIVVAVAHGCAGELKTAFLVVAALAGYEIALVALTQSIAAAAGRSQVPEDGSTRSVLWRRPLRLLAAIGLTQLAYAAATGLAVCRRQVTWRGIVYRLGTGGRLQRLNYVAAAELPDAVRSKRSQGPSPQDSAR